jgi:hypothetical protein
MPEKLTIVLDKKIELEDIPTSAEVKKFISSFNFSPKEYAELCRDKQFLKIMQQPLKITLEIIEAKQKEKEENPS